MTAGYTGSVWGGQRGPARGPAGIGTTGRCTRRMELGGTGCHATTKWAPEIIFLGTVYWTSHRVCFPCLHNQCLQLLTVGAVPLGQTSLVFLTQN